MNKTKIAVSAFTLGLAFAGSNAAQALDEVTYGTNWLAQAEHGGFYQAVADGTYEEYGLDVTIQQGGPQISNTSLLAAGKIDFSMGSTVGGFDAVKQGIPVVNVAAMFQKDPQVLMAHPGVGIDTFADIAKASKLILANTLVGTNFEWMKLAYEGFDDMPVQPYTFNPAPFIADEMSVQQGYVTSEPFAIEKETGWAPVSFLFADAGFDPYATTIQSRQELVDSNPDLVQRFVEASIIGWYNYLYGDNAAANELIKADNPDMTDDVIAYAIKEMKERGIVISGAAEDKGIGCMDDDRTSAFFEKLVAIGLFDESLDYKASYTTDFVCKGVGMDIAAQ